MADRYVPVAVVTGGGSGIGYEVVRKLLLRGWTVWELSRHDNAPEGAHHLHCDIASEESVSNAIGIVLNISKHIDVLVNNAGMGISGAIEFTSPEDSRRQIAVNLFGADNVTRAVLPGMRQNRTGRIIFVSSAAARFAIPFQAWYSVSKSAINAYALSLRNEVRPFGIGVSVVQPGDVKTGFTAARVKHHAGDELYGGKIDKAVSAMEKDEKNGMPPSLVAEAVISRIFGRFPSPLCTVGLKYKLFMVLARIFPERIINWIIGILY